VLSFVTMALFAAGVVGADWAERDGEAAATATASATAFIEKLMYSPVGDGECDVSRCPRPEESSHDCAVVFIAVNPRLFYLRVLHVTKLRMVPS
jgi:hypothetical protein